MPPVLEERAALVALRSAARQASGGPTCVTLMPRPRARGVCHVLDDDDAHARRRRGQPQLAARRAAAPEDVPWARCTTIPTAAVTGSNGKTTTVRLLAACARAHGWRDGLQLHGRRVHRSRDGGERRLLRSGRHAPRAARRDASRPRSSRRRAAASCAAGSPSTAPTSPSSPTSAPIISANTASTISTGLADVKLTVAAPARRAKGCWCSMPTTPCCCAKGRRCCDSGSAGSRRSAGSRSTTIIRALAQHRAAGGRHLRRARRTAARCRRRPRTRPAARSTSMPLTVDGTATYNVANLAGAALAGGEARHPARAPSRRCLRPSVAISPTTPGA